MDLAAKIESFVNSCANPANYGGQPNQDGADCLHTAKAKAALHLDRLTIPVKAAITVDAKLPDVTISDALDPLRPVRIVGARAAH